jgi:hypothetical protein
MEEEKSRRTFIESKNTSRVLNLLRQFEMPNLQFSTNSTNHKLPLTMKIELLIGICSTNPLQQYYNQLTTKQNCDNQAMMYIASNPMFPEDKGWRWTIT